MEITADLVRKVAHLARLRLAPGEELYYQGRLHSILEYVKQLEELPAFDESVGPSMSPAFEREDVVVPWSSDALAGIGQAPFPTFQVPRILE